MMRLDLKKLFDGAQQTLPFTHELDLGGIELWGEKPFGSPVRLQGRVENRAGIVTVQYRAGFTLSVHCARCAQPLALERELAFAHTVVRRLNQQKDDDYLVVEDGILDLDQLAQDDILLELPIRMLCSPDCKGLCPACGANLNHTRCGCKPEEWTPGSVRAFEHLL